MSAGDGTGATPTRARRTRIPRLGLRPGLLQRRPGRSAPGLGHGDADPDGAGRDIQPAAEPTPRQRDRHRSEATRATTSSSAPTVNIMRTPQGGRTYEAYGEDTYLVGRTTRRVDQRRAVGRGDRRRSSTSSPTTRRASGRAAAHGRQRRPPDWSTPTSPSGRCGRSTSRSSRRRSSRDNIGSVMCSYNRSTAPTRARTVTRC